MAVTESKIVIVGCGPGSAQYLTEAARTAVAGADVLLGSWRLLELFADSPARRITLDGDLAAMLEDVAARRAAGKRVAVLVTGDPGLYSFAQQVVRRFGPEQCEVVPAVSSVQVAFARLGLGWADARIVSAHARIPEVTPAGLSPAHKIAILVGVPASVRWAAGVAFALRASHAAFLAENLTLDDERFRPVTAEQLAVIDAASLSIVLLIRRCLLP